MTFYIEIDEVENGFTNFDKAIQFCEDTFGIDNLESFEWDEVKEEGSFFELESFLDDLDYEGMPHIFCWNSLD